MSLQIGDIAPDFQLNSTQGDIDFHHWSNSSWVILFSHPADFTPVCSTELAAVAARLPQFAERHTKVIGLSVDSIESHGDWAADIEQLYGVNLAFPILADPRREVASLYGMIAPGQSSNVTVRTVFIIDPAHTIRLTISYPLNVGRDFDELLRALDALQLADRHLVATPANWRPGQDVIIPLSVQDSSQIKRLYPAGYTSDLPYLRRTPDPSTQ